MSQLKLKPSRTQTEAHLIFRSGDPTSESTSSSCAGAMAKLRRSAGDYVRRIVDQAMGTKLLTEVLDETRKAKP